MWRLKSVLVLLCMSLCVRTVLCEECKDQPTCTACVKLNPTLKCGWDSPKQKCMSSPDSDAYTVEQQCPCSEFTTCARCAGRKMEGDTQCVYQYREIKLKNQILSSINPMCVQDETETETEESSVRRVSRSGGSDLSLVKIRETQDCSHDEDVYFGTDSPDDAAANAKPCDIGFGIFSSQNLQHLVSKSFPEAHPRGSHIQDFTTSGPCTADDMSIKMGEIAKLLSTIPKWPDDEFEKNPKALADPERESTISLFKAAPSAITSLLPDEVAAAADEADNVRSWAESMSTMFSPVNIGSKLKSTVAAAKTTAKAAATLAVDAFVPSSVALLFDIESIKPATPTGIFKGLTYGHLWRSYQRYKEERKDLPFPTHERLNEHVSKSRTMATFDVLDYDDNLVTSLALDIAGFATAGISSAVKTIVDSTVFALKLTSIAEHERNIQRRSDYIVNMLMSYDEHFRFSNIRAANGLFKPHYSPYIKKDSAFYYFTRTACEDVHRYCFYLGGILREKVKAEREINADYCVCLKIDLRTSKAGSIKKGEECKTDSDCELGLLCKSVCTEEESVRPVPVAHTPTCPWEQLIKCDSALVEVDRTIAKKDKSKEARWCAKEMEAKCLTGIRPTAACIDASRRCFERKFKLVHHQQEAHLLAQLECDAACLALVKANCPVSCLESLRFLYFARTHVGSSQVVVSDFLRGGSAEAVKQHIEAAGGKSAAPWSFQTAQPEVQKVGGEGVKAFLDLGSDTGSSPRPLHFALKKKKQ